ncbi:MAG: PAAR domain-containing protein [Lewinellaceae bacterium]|nr:PAAR domain-containing protein [Saprospiraceae bacterium]MCB9314783.1 PAAR domain-containing protein [Lewinellaceae bacterium]MCB9333127.1 PAAR domain-containing protein [Lewinellaceae bacterium]
MPPAARITDLHTSVPPVGPPLPILPPGCTTVLIGGLPAARAFDMVTPPPGWVVPPPDMIAKGSATVFIGGMPAARMGDTTASGRIILAGCPTVIIGG